MTELEKIDFSKLALESDRAVILIGSSILDTFLRRVLELFFFQQNRSIKIRSNEIFESMGPLSSSSAKMKLAYLNGLISNSIYEDLEKIRKLRNQAAHDLGHISFIQKSVELMVEGLNCTQGFQSGSKVDPKKTDDYDFEKDRELESIANSKGFVKYHKSIFVLGLAAIAGYLEYVCQTLEKRNKDVKDKENNIVSQIVGTYQMAEIVLGKKPNI
jgi:DNA-binding MltR family transcriptional regulator